MAMVLTRRMDRVAERRIIAEAQKKKARSDDPTDFNMVAHKFVTAVLNIRQVMKKIGSEINYDYFFGGFEQCDALLQDPAFIASSEAQYAYQLLLGADTWLKHEADKLGEEYVSPNHFYKAWELHGIDLRHLSTQQTTVS